MGGRSAHVPPPSLKLACPGGREGPFGPWVRHAPSRATKTPWWLEARPDRLSKARRVALGGPAEGRGTLLGAMEVVWGVALPAPPPPPPPPPHPKPPYACMPLRETGSVWTLGSAPTLARHHMTVVHRCTPGQDFEGPESCTRGPNGGPGHFTWCRGGGLGGRSAHAPPPPELAYPCGSGVLLDSGYGTPPSRATI